jgi:osmotically-inducible protein OsmY
MLQPGRYAGLSDLIVAHAPPAVILPGRVMWLRTASSSLVANRTSEQERWRGGPMKTGSEIRDDVVSELQWGPQITDPDAIGVAVQDGAVTLTGHVPTYAERLAAVRAAERVYGVKAVANDLTVKPPASPQKVQEVIEDAFKREAEVDARHISVGVSDHTAKLYGHVHSVHEATAAQAAASAPGISAVESHLVVSP